MTAEGTRMRRDLQCVGRQGLLAALVVLLGGSVAAQERQSALPPRPVLPAPPAVAAPSPPPAGVRLHLVTGQPGVPVVIESARSSGEYFFQHLRVRNTGAHAVVAIGLALNVGAGDAAAEGAVWRRAHLVRVRVAPGEARDLELTAFPVAAVTALTAGVGQPEVELGLVAVEWAEGPGWQLPTAGAWFGRPGARGTAQCLDGQWAPRLSLEGVSAEERVYRRCLAEAAVTTVPDRR